MSPAAKKAAKKATGTTRKRADKAVKKIAETPSPKPPEAPEAGPDEAPSPTLEDSSPRPVKRQGRGPYYAV